MHDSSHPKRLTRPTRARLLAATALVSAVLVAGCGGAGSSSPTVASASSTSTATPSATSTGAATTSTLRTTTSNSAASSGPPTQDALEADELAYSKCMRANGVPNFPDPTAGGGFLFSSSAVDRSSPAFIAAQAKCKRLLPGGGLPGPGTSTHPTTEALAEMVKIAACMRRHGVSDFPDPQTSVPSNPFPAGSAGVISDIDGVILVFPESLDTQSPLFTKAAATCQFPLHNH